MLPKLRQDSKVALDLKYFVQIQDYFPNVWLL